MKKNSNTIFNVIKIFLGKALLVLSLWGINWNLLITTLSAVKPGWLIAAGLSVIVSLGLKVVRWYMLLRNYGIKVTFIQTASSFCLGQAANIVLPMRGGEVVRFGWLRSQQDRGTAFLITANIPIQEIQKNVIGLAIGGLFLTIALFVAIWLMPHVWQANRGKIESKVPVRFKSFAAGFDRWMSESKLIRQPKYLFPVFGITLLIWIVMTITNLMLFKAFGLPALVVAGALVLVGIYVGVLPALMPGNIGPFYFFAGLALAPFGFDPQVRLAYAILLHGIVTIPPLLMAGCSVLFSRFQSASPDYPNIT